MEESESSQYSDEELIKMTLTDPDQFKHLVRRYEARFLRFIRRITNVGQESAEDILQEAFIKIYKNLRSFDIDMKFSNWAYRIVRNETISNYRKMSRQPLYSFDILPDSVLSRAKEDFFFDKDFDKKQEIEKLLSIINKLSRKYREVIELFYFEGFSYKEISDIIRKPTATVGTLLNRAKKKIKKIYEYSE